MYNSKHIKKFIEDTHVLAEAAAQKIYNERQQKLEELIKAQLIEGDKLLIGNGTAIVIRAKGKDVNEEFVEIISNTQYSHLSAGFSLDDIKK